MILRLSIKGAGRFREGITAVWHRESKFLYLIFSLVPMPVDSYHPVHREKANFYQ